MACDFTIFQVILTHAEDGESLPLTHPRLAGTCSHCRAIPTPSPLTSTSSPAAHPRTQLCSLDIFALSLHRLLNLMWPPKDFSCPPGSVRPPTLPNNSCQHRIPSHPRQTPPRRCRPLLSPPLPLLISYQVTWTLAVLFFSVASPQDLIISQLS